MLGKNSKGQNIPKKRYERKPLQGQMRLNIPGYLRIVCCCVLVVCPADAESEWKWENRMDTIVAAENSIVKEIHASVLIRGDSHEALWNVPTVASVPGAPITVYLSVNVADRFGRDQSFGKHLFMSRDFFETLEKIETAPDHVFGREFAGPGPGLSGFPEAISHTYTSPAVYLDRETAIKAFTLKKDEVKYHATSALCKVREEKLVPVVVGNAHTIEASRRGLYEPHMVGWNGRFYMTGRSEDGRGYLLVSDDGLMWQPPQPWAWDNGEEIPMDQTMTKLLVHSNGLVLVYTRIREDNKNTFRHSAPLHVADLHPETLRLKRDTERIIVPDKGMALGNFTVWPITPQESYVTTGEWPRDGRTQNGDIWLCKIRWRTPNLRLTEDGFEKAALREPERQ